MCDECVVLCFIEATFKMTMFITRVGEGLGESTWTDI